MLRRFIFCALFLAHPALAQSTIDVPAASRAALGVETAPVKAAQRYAAVSALGVVEAPAGALTTAQTPFGGVVVRALVIPGQMVKAGEPIAIIRSADYPKAQADLAAAKKMRDHRAEIYERAQRLHKLGLRTLEEADEAGHDAYEAALFYKAEQQRLSLFQAGDLAGTFQMVAPGDGLVTAMNVHSGDTLDAGAPVATLFSGDRYWARTQVSSGQGAGLKSGAPVRVAGQDRPGEIVAITPSIDPATRSIELMAVLPASQAYRLGDVVNLTIESAAPDGAYSVPTRAVVRMDGGDALFVEGQDGFMLTPVTVLARTGGNALVQGNIQDGARVAIAGVAALKNMALGG